MVYQNQLEFCKEFQNLNLELHSAPVYKSEICKKSIGYQCNKDTNHIIPMGLILNVDETPHSNFGVGRCSNGGGTTEIVVFCHFHVV